MEELKLMYECFRKAFNEFDLSYDVFKDKLSWGKNTYLTRYDNDKLIGFAIVRDDNLCCLCVDPIYQNKGYGSSLLKEAEKKVLDNGFNK
ncbi:MAG: GNAT family N-acetyltransferase, partial [Bacilli bacterium]|nr:GNAT family N-acetyltransferase [Bacilli bacterium]